jgi:hypothetical protein
MNNRNILTNDEKELLIAFIAKNDTYDTIDRAVFKHAICSFIPQWRAEQLIDVYQYNADCEVSYNAFIESLESLVK